MIKPLDRALTSAYKTPGHTLGQSAYHFNPGSHWWDAVPANDILGVWLFDDANNGTPFVDVVNNRHFRAVQGNPQVTPGVGVVFGGAGCLATPLPDGTDVSDLSVLIQFENVRQNNDTLDAFYSHFYNDNILGHYVLQYDWADTEVRWSCGDVNSLTIEVPFPLLDSGIVVTAGRRLIFDGIPLATVPESSPTVSNGNDFHLGCVRVDAGFRQGLKGTVKKLLVATKALSPSEIYGLYYNLLLGGN